MKFLKINVFFQRKWMRNHVMKQKCWNKDTKLRVLEIMHTTQINPSAFFLFCQHLFFNYFSIRYIYIYLYLGAKKFSSDKSHYIAGNRNIFCPVMTYYFINVRILENQHFSFLSKWVPSGPQTDLCPVCLSILWPNPLPPSVHPHNVAF